MLHEKIEILLMTQLLLALCFYVQVYKIYDKLFVMTPTNSLHIKAIALMVIILAFFIVKPLLTPILSAAILAYLFYPIYLKLVLLWSAKQNALGKTISAFLVVLLVVFTFLIPLWGLIVLLGLNAKAIMSLISSLAPGITNLFETIQPNLQSSFLKNLDINLNLTMIFSSLALQAFKFTQHLIAQIPSLIFSSFVTLFVMYYLLKNATKMIELVNEWLPISDYLREQSLKRFNHLCRGLIGSQFVIAICQAILMGIACLILGLHHKILIIIITFVFAVIPFVGAFAVWVGISIYLLIEYLSGTGALWHPIFLVIYGTFLVSIVDNIVRPKMLSEAAKINPAIVLIGFIGGFILFGVPGFFLGPIILTFVEISLKTFYRTLNKTTPKLK